MSGLCGEVVLVQLLNREIELLVEPNPDVRVSCVPSRLWGPAS